LSIAKLKVTVTQTYYLNQKAIDYFRLIFCLEMLCGNWKWARTNWMSWYQEKVVEL